MFDNFWGQRGGNAPSHVRVALVLVVGGVAALVPGLLDSVIGVLRQSFGLPPAQNVPPWIGVFLVLAGILVFGLGTFFSRRGVAGDLAFKVSLASGSKRVHRLKQNSSVRIGRAKDNDLIVDDEYVSRHHCVVHVLDDHIEIRDLGPKNLVRINGIEVRKGLLKVNDSMTLGETEFTLVSYV